MNKKINKYCCVMDYNDDYVLIYDAISKKMNISKKDLFQIDDEKKIISTKENADYPEDMIKNGVIIDSDISEIDLLKYHCENRYHGLSSGMESFFHFQMTNKCNFDCDYCNYKRLDTFDKDFTDDGYASQDVINNTITFLGKITKNVKHLSLGFLGGEPFLNPGKSIEVIDSFYKAYKTEENHFSLNIITNGYGFTPEVVDYLNSIDIERLILQITLDGTEEVHNQRRSLKNGDPTFKVILSNIEYTQKNYKGILDFFITPVVDIENADGVLELGKYLRSNGFLSKTLFSVQNWDNGVRMNARVLPECGHTIFEDDDREELWREFTNRMAMELGIPSQKLVYRKLEPCKASMTKSFGVDVSGNVYKCLGSLGKTDDSIGTVFDDNIPLNQKGVLSLLSSRLWDFDDCRECLLLPMCIPERCIRKRIDNVDCSNRKRIMQKTIMLDMFDFGKRVDMNTEFKSNHSSFSEELFYEVRN